MCNVLYKICANVLANQLKLILSSMISHFHSAFVLGKHIFDNSLLAAEVGHFLHNRRRGSKGFLDLKLDLSKAYDRVEWGFLEAMLLRLGFAEAWV